MIDSSLIEQVKKGNLSAFEKLVEETKQQGFNIAYGILQDPLDAEDVLQEAYLQVFHNIRKLNAPEAFKSWFTKIIIHLSFQYSKKKGRYKTIPLNEITQNETTFNNTPEIFVLKQEETEQLVKALKLLPDEYRIILILREWEEYSYQEISETLDIPLGTVKSRIFYARKMLLDKLKEGGI